MPQSVRAAIAALIALALSAAALAADNAAAAYSFKARFPELVKGWQKDSYNKAASVSLEEKDVFKTAPAVRIDCQGSKERVVVTNYGIPKDALEAIKGKPILFQARVKRLRGQGEVGAMLRLWDKENKLVAATPAVKASEAKPGEWGLLELRGMVPAGGLISHADIHFWVLNSPQPPAVIIDEAALKVEEKGTASEAPVFAGSVAAQEAGKPAPPLVLARGGKPLATIIIAKPASTTVQAAVKELNDHLQLVAGCKLPVVDTGAAVEGATVHIGATDLTRRLGLAPEFLAPDHWLVWRVGGALVLSGGDTTESVNPLTGHHKLPFGTLYAVYEFLERAAEVRWYWPGDMGRVAPKRDELSVGAIRWQGAPSYETRFGWYALHRDPAVSAADSALWWRRMRAGTPGGGPVANHSFNAWPKQFGKDHPEWFALQRNGSRASENPLGHLCFSNPEVLKQTIAEKRAFFDKYPGQRYAAVMAGDSLDLYYCQCPQCKALEQPEKGARGKHSRMMWGFVNKVAEALRESHPDRFITCCSYSSYADPPEGIKLLPNVAVTICDNTFPVSAFKPGAKQAYLNRIEAWGQQASNLYIWDYWLSRYSRGVYGAPAVYPRLIKEWFLLDRGRVLGHAIELPDIDAGGKGVNGWADWVYDSLNVYVGMRLLWNMDTDVEQLLDEFYPAFFGPAAPLIRKFDTALEKRFTDINIRGGQDAAWDWSSCWVKTYPPEFVKESVGWLREAEKITRGQEPYHARAAKVLSTYLHYEANSQRFASADSGKIANEKLIVKTGPAPVVDGALDDEGWKTAAAATGFYDSFNASDLKAQTEMRFLRAGGVLYVAVRAPLSGQIKIDLPAGSRDGWVWNQESVELFFVQGVKKYQFLLGPDNVYADNYHPDHTAKFSMDMFKWNCEGAQLETQRNDKEWTAELAIPLKSLDLAAPTAKEPWQVNFCRNHYYPVAGVPGVKDGWMWEQSSWRPTFGSFHNIERFGVMVFE
ncbi:MAG TPA: DUF4838 domain-containing protein [Candidatus Brocadiia bacterium]|nr:DUF4838 domain-containing protein [Candidatus Brocadiia bacterium]